MDDLITWLRECLDEDERVAREASGRRWKREAISCVVDAATDRLVVYGEGTPTPEQADHITRWDPARVLAEIDAKRRVVELHSPYEEYGDCSSCGDVPQVPFPCDTLRLLALPYADREGYRDEWRP